MMKAFLIILVILVVAAGVVFYFGWIQIQLPPDHYGVIFTKTGGYDSRVVRPGEFVWRWEALVPTNLTLYRFDLEPRQVEVSFDRNLPSAELYASVLPDKPAFVVRGRLQVTFTLAPDSLPGLVKEKSLTPDGLGAFYDTAARDMTETLQLQLRNLEPAELQRPLEPALREALAARMPYLQVTALVVQGLEMPDMELYQLARQSYRNLADVYQREREQATVRLAAEQAQADRRSAEEESRLASLRKYGELFNEYPVLLKALAIEKLGGDQKVNVPELDLSGLLDLSVGR
jgi:hypothetical protein